MKFDLPRRPVGAAPLLPLLLFVHGCDHPRAYAANGRLLAGTCISADCCDTPRLSRPPLG